MNVEGVGPPTPFSGSRSGSPNSFIDDTNENEYESEDEYGSGDAISVSGDADGADDADDEALYDILVRTSPTPAATTSPNTVDLRALGVPDSHLGLPDIARRAAPAQAPAPSSATTTTTTTTTTTRRRRRRRRRLRYLDIGAGLAHKTELVGHQFGVKPRDTVCLEKHGTAFPFDKHRGFTFEFYDGRTIPYPAESFDVVSCMQVLHHVRTAKGLVREIVRVLRPGGVVVIQDHDVAEGDEDTKRFLRAVHFLYASKNREGYGSLVPSTYRPASKYATWFKAAGLRALGPPRFRKKPGGGAMRTFVSLFHRRP